MEFICGTITERKKIQKKHFRELNSPGRFENYPSAKTKPSATGTATCSERLNQPDFRCIDALEVISFNGCSYLSSSPRHQRWAPPFSTAFPALLSQQHPQVSLHACWLGMDFHHVEAAASQSAVINQFSFRFSTTSYLNQQKNLPLHLKCGQL